MSNNNYNFLNINSIEKSSVVSYAMDPSESEVVTEATDPVEVAMTSEDGSISTEQLYTAEVDGEGHTLVLDPASVSIDGSGGQNIIITSAAGDLASSAPGTQAFTIGSQMYIIQSDPGGGVGSEGGLDQHALILQPDGVTVSSGSTSQGLFACWKYSV